MYDDYTQSSYGLNYSPYDNTYDFIYSGSNLYSQTEDCNQFNCPFNYMNKNFSSKGNYINLESLYPEIYTVIYPMIKKACSQMSMPINKEVLDEITNDIYSNIEADNTINFNINTDNNRNESKTTSGSKVANSDNRDKPHFNPILDLIKILLIRELDRKPFPPRPPNPNFSGPSYPRPPILEYPFYPPRPRF